MFKTISTLQKNKKNILEDYVESFRIFQMIIFDGQ